MAFSPLGILREQKRGKKKKAEGGREGGSSEGAGAAGGKYRQIDTLSLFSLSPPVVWAESKFTPRELLVGERWTDV